jgi:hypothetical protein
MNTNQFIMFFGEFLFFLHTIIIFLHDTEYCIIGIIIRETFGLFTDGYTNDC